MSTIVAGHFDHIEQAQQALQELARRDFDAADYACYYLNPPGQHALFPLGGDAAADEGARDAAKGAAAGAALGGAAGLAAGSLGGPVGALAGAGVGAYVGSLAGAVASTHSPREGAADAEHPAERPGGPMVAVCADRPGAEAAAITILGASGAREIERAQGAWRDGGWADYDPRVPTETLLRDEPATGGSATPSKEH